MKINSLGEFVLVKITEELCSQFDVIICHVLDYQDFVPENVTVFLSDTP